MCVRCHCGLHRNKSGDRTSTGHRPGSVRLPPPSPRPRWELGCFLFASTCGDSPTYDSSASAQVYKYDPRDHQRFYSPAGCPLVLTSLLRCRCTNAVFSPQAAHPSSRSGSVIAKSVGVGPYPTLRIVCPSCAPPICRTPRSSVMSVPLPAPPPVLNPKHPTSAHPKFRFIRNSRKTRNCTVTSRVCKYKMYNLDSG